MILYQAINEEFESIMSFYDDVTERTPCVERFARWKKGKHPTANSIRAYIEEGSMYLYKEHDKIVGAMAVTMYQGEDYHAIEWAEKADDNEVAVIHILAVSPDFQGKGIGSKMVQEAVRLAQAIGKKTIRLDALASNIPAHRIYVRLGFVYRGKQHLYAENTGWTDFYFFEYRNEKYSYLTLRDKLELKDAAADWFSSKWNVPKEAYLACMDEYLQHQTELGWYLCLDGDRIVGGLGVIENDFHDRKDLSPNICAVYTEEDHRRQGIAGRLLNMAMNDLRTKGVTPVYLLTNHVGFYERYGWEFLCMAQGDGETYLSRMYIHR